MNYPPGGLSGRVAATGDLTGSAPCDNDGDGAEDSWSAAFGRFDGSTMVAGQNIAGDVFVICITAKLGSA